MNQTQKHTHGKKLLALLLALVMMVSLLPMSAFATEPGAELAPAVTQPAEAVQEPAALTEAPAAAPADEPAAPADKTAEAPTEEPTPVEDEEPPAAAMPAALSDDVAVAAETGKTVVIACSDFQYPNNSTGDTQGAATVTAVLNRMKAAGYTTADGFLFAGDYQYGYVNSDTLLTPHITALKNAVKGVYTDGITHQVYVQGNHDEFSYAGSSNLSAAGANDADGYGVYVIHEDDYMWKSNVSNVQTSHGSMTAGQIVQQTADSLKSYLDAKRTEGYTKPIFVVSHLPLHYSMRTLRDGDGMYANYIFNVLNEAGEAGLNIIFLYGHNHSHGWDDYLGGSHVYLAKGDNIIIAQNSQTKTKTETLRFTYMNAGYTGYYSYSDSKTNLVADNATASCGTNAPLTMTLFEIDDTQVTIHRYGQNGEEVLKNAGASKCDYFTAAQESANGCPVNSDVYAAAQTITLNTNITAPITPDVGEGEGEGEGTTTPDAATVDVSLNVGGTYGPVDVTGYTATEDGTVDLITDNDQYLATAKVTTTTTGGNTEYTPVPSIAAGKYYVSTKANDTNPSVKLTIETDNGTYYLKNGEDQYIYPNASYTSIMFWGSWSYSDATGQQAVTVTQNGSGYTFSRNVTSSDQKSTTAYLTLSGDSFGASGSSTTLYLYTKKDVIGTTSSALTIAGVGEGETSVVVGDTTYNITVTAPTTEENKTLYLNGNFTPAGADVAVKGSAVTYVDGKIVAGDTEGKATVTSVDKNAGGYVTHHYTYNVTVRERSQASNYPEYPDPGSVHVNKTGAGIDFQDTGVAKVELSTTGVPMNAGVDVIVMLDTSSSMQYGLNTNSNASAGSQRIDYLRTALSDMLESFNTPDSTTGQPPDIRVAIADFNNYESTDTNAPIYLDPNDYLTGHTSGYHHNKKANGEVFTGSGEFDAGAFVSATDLADFDTSRIVKKSGTNYDAAFYYTYQLGAAITAKNVEDGVERDLYVVFMSDGAPFQYNFFHAYSDNDGSENWNKWLTGSYTSLDEVPTDSSHRYFYNTDGNKHWWAEAIKGDPNSEYTVIDKTTTEAYDGKRYMKRVNGLGATMYSIGFALLDDKQITVDIMENVLKKVATSDSYYFMANDNEKLNDAFTQIASRIKMAGKNAVFTDVMGDAYDLKITPITKVDGKKVADPTITVSSYELYKLSEIGTTVNGVPVTEKMVGTRKNPDSPNVLETVTFNEDGTAAYSNLINNGTTNILTDGEIQAVNFTYNLESETFTWTVGNITEDELVLSYYVYLTGSIEGNRAAGSYPTNNSAVLTYTNWLGNNARKDTVSPEMAWKSATVSYAYYLVNGDGEPIVNQTTGQTGSIVNAVKVTEPVVYSTLLLNSSETIEADLAAEGVLPEGYTLYDEAAAYRITVNSGAGGGSWEITKGSGADVAATTYVTGYGETNQYSNTLEVSENSYDYTKTIVYFAVLYQVSCIPDSVVIDFGLPVDISVLANDILGQEATLKGLAESYAGKNTEGTETMDSTFSTNALTLTHGTAAINGEKVRYTPKDMQMNSVDTFAYAAQAAATNDTKFYYTTVTVIPAANIYYEDSFVEFTDGTGTAATGKWTPEGTTLDKTQAEDRPGETSLPAYDANNVYGYDKAYSECATYSLGSAQKVTVDSSITTSPTASFTFTGTGFDLISLTSNTTGTILVNVMGKDNGVTKNWIVDTYYGYTRTQNGYTKYTWTFGGDEKWHATEETVQELPSGATTGGTPTNPGDVTYEVNYTWTVTEDTDNALYQIPVIRGQGLEYGTYTVTITPKYSSARDWASAGSYDFYLDAVRVYDPAGATPDGAIGDAYKADGEAYADVIELRNLLIDAGTLVADKEKEGIVFIDGVPAAGLADYTNYGPNNEVYLAENQAIAFKLKDDNSKIASIQLGVKAPDGEAIAKVTENGTATTIKTATEMYYDITHRVTWDKDTPGTSNVIVITNTGDNILSLTNLKVTYKENPAATASTLVDEQVVEEAPVVLMRMLGYEAPAPVEPEVFAPERFEASWNRDTVRAGQKATLTVKTSEDVAYIQVDGQTIDTYRTRTQRTGWGASATTVTYRQFTYTITAAETADYTVTAFNADDVASESITTTLAVQAASQGSGLVGWLESIFGRWF